MLTIDALAQEIRRVDGNHSLGAGALAEALMPFLLSASAAGGVDAVALREICEDMLEMHHGRQASMDVDAPSFGRGAAAGWDAAVSAFYKRALASLSPAPTSGSEAGGEPACWTSEVSLKMAAQGLPAVIHAYPPPVEPVALYRGGAREVVEAESPAGGVREALERLKERERDTGWHPMYRDGLMQAIREIDAALGREG